MVVSLVLTSLFLAARVIDNTATTSPSNASWKWRTHAFCWWSGVQLLRAETGMAVVPVVEELPLLLVNLDTTDSWDDISENSLTVGFMATAKCNDQRTGMWIWTTPQISRYFISKSKNQLGIHSCSLAIWMYINNRVWWMLYYTGVLNGKWYPF